MSSNWDRIVTTGETSAAAVLAGLNEQQRQAVLHGDEPLLVVAGAGTGKTATLVHRVAYKIAMGTNPRRILLLTFTRRAAGEMLRRIDGILRRLEAGRQSADACRAAGCITDARSPETQVGDFESDNEAAADGGLGGTGLGGTGLGGTGLGGTGLADAGLGGPGLGGPGLGGPGLADAESGRTPAARAPSAGARPPLSGAVWGGTFHAVATRLLRIHGRSIGLDPSFTILDRGDAEDLMGVVRTELGLSKNDRRFPLKGTCMDIYSRCVNARESVEQTVETRFPWCTDEVEDLRRLFAAYVDRKGRQNVLDYDDLLLFWHGLLTDPHTARSIRSRFDYVLVDEYQDTNRLQAEILQMLCPGGRNLTVVGDDAQAIYSFRAATVRNILDFPQQFPGTRIVTLEQNYRSTQPILDATNEVIAEAAEGHPKHLWSQRPGGAKPELVTCEDEDEQTEYVIRQVLQHREEEVPLRRQAVLFRASHHSLALELELSRRNIPYRKYGGLRFTETAHIKDLLAFLRLAENPHDLMAGTRVLMLLPGIGPKKARALMDLLGAGEASAGANGKRTDAVPGFSAWIGRPAPSSASASMWGDLVSLMTGLSSDDPGDVASQIRRIRLFYAPLLERLYEGARARLMDLEQLEWLAARFPDRARFLAEIALDPPSYAEDLAGPPVLDEDFLVLSTMHSAKGLEWDAVFVIHASDGNIPSDMATGRPEEIEEERRLFYVALTRAKDWLHVCHPLRYYTLQRSCSDTYGYAQPSRFLSKRVRETFQPVLASEFIAPESRGAASATAAPTGQTLSTAEIRRRLKEMF